MSRKAAPGSAVRAQGAPTVKPGRPLRPPGRAWSAAFTSPIAFVNEYESSVWRELARSAVPNQTYGAWGRAQGESVTSHR